jgi:hypothetical protein
MTEELFTEGAVQRDVEDPQPLLVGHVDELSGAAEPGVVDHHVEAAVLGHDRADQVLDLVLLGDVADDAAQSEARGRLGEPPLVPVGDDDGRALLDRLLRGGEADAGAGGRGDDHDLVLQEPVPGHVVRHPPASSGCPLPRP